MIVALPTHAVARTRADATLRLMVVDSTGPVVTGAKVRVIDTSTLEQRPCTTGSLGDCDFNVPPGTYEVHVDTPSHAHHSSIVIVGLGTSVFHKITLAALAPQAEPTPEVKQSTDEVTVIGTLRSANPTMLPFDRAQVEQLPLNGRSLQSLLRLVPGVVFTDPAATQGQLSVQGARRTSNAFSIDGVSIQLSFDGREPGMSPQSGGLAAFGVAGGTQTAVPTSAIERIEVHRAPDDAEHTRTTGAHMILVTRAGSAKRMGEWFMQVRPPGLAAASWFATAAPATTRPPHYATMRATSSGPALPRQRLLYYATWEGQSLDRAGGIPVRVPSPSLRKRAPSTMDWFIQRVPPVEQAASDQDVGDTVDVVHPVSMHTGLSVGSVRLDTMFSSGQHLFARINRGVSRNDGNDAVRNRPPSLSGRIEETLTESAMLGSNNALSTRVMHQLRLSLMVHRGSLAYGASSSDPRDAFPLSLFAPPGSSAADTVVAISAGPAGPLLVSGRFGTWRQRQVQATDTWSISTPRHEWRMGLDVRRVLGSSLPPSARFTYRFTDSVELVDGRVQLVSVERFTPARALFRSVSLFVQDAYAIVSRVTLFYGLRLTVEPPPVSGTDLQPALVEFGRLPLVWRRPTGAPLWRTSRTVAPHVALHYRFGSTANRSTVLSVWLSRAYDNLIPPGATAFGHGSPYKRGWTIGGPAEIPLPAPALTMSPTSTPVSVDLNGSTATASYAFAPDLRPPSTDAWRVGISRDFGHGQRLSGSYVGTAGRDLMYGEMFYVTAPETTRVLAYVNAGSSRYDALQIEYARPSVRRIMARAAYTWARAIDTDSGEAVFPNAPASWIAPDQNRGPADFDIRHMLQMAASYHVPALAHPRWLRAASEDWHVSAMLSFRSGVPVDVVVLREIRGGVYQLRPDVRAGVPLWFDDPAAPTGRRINPDAFVMPTEPRQGTLGRNALRASPLRQLDLAVSRTTRLGRGFAATWRAEAFNIFNVANFGPPDGSLTSSSFGRAYQTYAEALGSGTLTRGGLVPVEQVGGPRAIQVSVLVNF